MISRRSRFVAGPLTTALALACVGCALGAGGSTSSAFSGAAGPNGPADLVPVTASGSSWSEAGAPDSGDVQSSADAGAAPAKQGSPLCNASWANPANCYPDDVPTLACGPASVASSEASSEADDSSAPNDAADGGDASAAAACHVLPDVDAGPEAGVNPGCLAGGPGVDGDACRDATDCAPTYECVGTGTCRRYCCYEACDGVHFCDVQFELRSDLTSVPVPVCMPVVPCVLLAPSGCNTGQTCSVVVVGGKSTTACVQTGGAGVGQSCDADRCQAGLTCIGAWGSKLCYQLCHTADASSECGPAEICTGGMPLFPDPLAGVCTVPVAPAL